MALRLIKIVEFERVAILATIFYYKATYVVWIWIASLVTISIILDTILGNGRINLVPICRTLLGLVEYIIGFWKINAIFYIAFEPMV